MAAVLIFVVVAAVIAIIGATAGMSLLGGEDEGDSPPFRLLPIEVPAPTSAAPDPSVIAVTTPAMETAMPALGTSGRIAAVDARADGLADASR